ALALQCPDNLHQVGNRARQPVEFRHNESVTLADVFEGRRQPRALCNRGHLPAEHLVTAKRLELAQLRIEPRVLMQRAGSRVSNDCQCRSPAILPIGSRRCGESLPKARNRTLWQPAPHLPLNLGHAAELPTIFKRARKIVLNEWLFSRRPPPALA